MNAVPERRGKARGGERNQPEKNRAKSRTLHGVLLREAAGLYQQRKRLETRTLRGPEKAARHARWRALTRISEFPILAFPTCSSLTGIRQAKGGLEFEPTGARSPERPFVTKAAKSKTIHEAANR